MIRNIIFDFGGVLLDLAPERCKAAFRAIGFVEIDSLLDTAHQRGLLDQMERGTIGVGNFCDAVRQTMALRGASSLPDDDAILTAWRTMADGIPAERLRNVARLKERGYNVSALSNTNVVHWAHCRPMFLAAGYAPETLFDHLWLSCDLHLAKPDPRVFECVLRLSGYRPEETLFVDDSMVNCRVAEGFGIRTYVPPMAPTSTSPSGERTVCDWRVGLEKILADE